MPFETDKSTERSPQGVAFPARFALIRYYGPRAGNPEVLFYATTEEELADAITFYRRQFPGDSIFQVTLNECRPIEAE